MKYKVKASCNLSLRVKKKQPSPRAQAVCRPPPPPLAVPVKKKQLSPRGHVVRRLQSATMRPSMYAIGGSGRAYERWREEQRNTRVQLYTCGFHEMGCPKRCVGMAVLLRCGVRADSEMDCTVFKTRAQESVGKCTGEHVAILKEMCQHTEQLDACFRLLQDTIFRHFEDPECGSKDGPIGILVSCSDGKHRSRALARLLDYILRRLGGFTVDGPIHLCSTDCGRLNCPHGCCWAGGKDSTEKLALFEWAYHRYNIATSRYKNGTC